MFELVIFIVFSKVKDLLLFALVGMSHIESYGLSYVYAIGYAYLDLEVFGVEWRELLY